MLKLFIKKNTRGQSSIEFLITFAFLFFLLIACVKLSLDFTAGYMAHYATFSASRTFLTWDSDSDSIDSNDQAAFSAAKIVFDQFKLNVYGVDVSGGLKANLPTTVKSIYIGNWFEFKQKFGASNFFGGGEATLRSESFLGREPTKAECLQGIVNAFSNIPNAPAANKKLTTYYDNGC